MITTEDTDILIIGAGPAGIAAACSASSRGARVLLVDENPAVGGQIWRGIYKGAAAKWRARLHESSARVMGSATVVDRLPTGEILVNASRPFRVRAREIIVATGARELFLPFPGWTLPGVCGVGALQTLAKTGYDVRGKRVLLAGSGPLLLAVAHGLADLGASILAIVEQADKAAVNAFAYGLWKHPAKLIQAAWLKAGLFGVPYWTGAWPVRAEPTSDTDPTLKAVTLFDGTQELRVECDLLACAFGLVPNTHLAAMLGCRIDHGVVSVDELLRSGPAGIRVAGEPTGIGGVEVSLLEGQVAGLAAAGAEAEARKLLPSLKRARAFGEALNTTFALRPELRKLVRHETTVCRCEDVPWGRIKACSSWRDAKLQTRCGMGPCQGRICGPAVKFLTGWAVADARPPAASVAVRALVELLGDDPAPGSAATQPTAPNPEHVPEPAPEIPTEPKTETDPTPAIPSEPPAS